MGIGIYFSLYNEPPLWIGSLFLLKTLILLYLFRRHAFLKSLLIGLCLIALGFAAAQFRAWSVTAPLYKENFSPQTITGVVHSIEKKTDKWHVVLGHLENLRYKTIRFTLRGEKQQTLSKPRRSNNSHRYINATPCPADA